MTLGITDFEESTYNFSLKRRQIFLKIRVRKPYGLEHSLILYTEVR